MLNSKLLIFIEIFYDVNVKRWKQHNRFTSFHCKTLIQQLIHGIPFDIQDKIICNLSNVRINLKYPSQTSIGKRNRFSAVSQCYSKWTHRTSQYINAKIRWNLFNFIVFQCLLIYGMVFFKRNFLIGFFGFISLGTAKYYGVHMSAWAHIRALIVPIKSRQQYVARLVYAKHFLLWSRDSNLNEYILAGCIKTHASYDGLTRFWRYFGEFVLKIYCICIF